MVMNSKARSETLDRLEPNTTYRIRVQAFYNGYKSQKSDPKYMTTLAKGAGKLCT